MDQTQNQAETPPFENPSNSTFLQGILEGIKSDNVSTRTKNILRELYAMTVDSSFMKDIRAIDNAVARHTYPDINYNRIAVYDRWPAVNKDFSGSTREFFLLICTSLKGSYYLEVNYKNLAEYTGISESTLQKSVHKLKDMGLITRYLPPITKASEPEVVMICPWAIGTGKPNVQNKAMLTYINLLDINGYFQDLCDYHKANNLDFPEYDDKVNYLMYRLGDANYSRNMATTSKAISLNRKSKTNNGVGKVNHDEIQKCFVTAVTPIRDPLLQPSTPLDDVLMPNPASCAKSKRRKTVSPARSNRLAKLIAAKKWKRITEDKPSDEKEIPHARQHEENNMIDNTQNTDIKISQSDTYVNDIDDFPGIDNDEYWESLINDNLNNNESESCEYGLPIS